MKGLIFNLLDNMARQSGCADEAWDLVMEFVASETDGDSDDTCLSSFSADGGLLSLETPGEMMMQCLSSDAAGLVESLSEFPDLALDAEDRLGDSIPALVDPDFCSPSIAPAEGFSHDLLSLLEQLLAEALTGDEPEDFDDCDDGTPFGWNPPRGSES